MENIFTTKNGIRVAARKIGHDMRIRRQILKSHARLSLGDLILAVSSCARNKKETVATVAELFASGKVLLQNDGRFTRARVC
jgi:hypothetical protein